MARVCVLGAGPAGCVFAARMATLGHDTHLIERERFPRPRLGESLTPGVAPLLQAAQLLEALEGPYVRRADAVRVNWEDGVRVRELGRDAGFLVDRGAFDSALLEGARRLGVRVYQPARLIDWRRDESGWRFELEIDGRRKMLMADFLADSRGRGAGSPGSRRRSGARALATFAYWSTRIAPRMPRIEAFEDGWAWGVPLPGGLYNTLVFLDPKSPRAAGESLERRFLRRVHAIGLLDDCVEPRRVGAIGAIDATPYLDEDSVGIDFLRLGDRAMAIDPLSSSGVQKAARSALSGAIVANTLLRRPERAGPAIAFYRDQLAEAYARHEGWAGQHYAAAAAGRNGAFWRQRAAPAVSEPEPALHPIDSQFLSETRVSLSSRTEWVTTPCLSDRFVTLAPALRHPSLARPVAYLSGLELAPLLANLPPDRTPLEIARDWSPRIPLETGLGVAAWLAARGILETRAMERAPA